MFRRLSSASPKGKPRILGDRRIHLHLGAHKTATTYLQRNLTKNKEILLESGVLYLPLVETRAGLSNPLLALSKSSRDAKSLANHREELLDALGRKNLAGCHTVLISDENLLGGPGGFRKGKIFQGIPEIWSHVHDELGPNISVSFSIRDYPGFISSVYAEIIRKYRYVPFNKIRDLFGEVPTLWSDVHRDLSATFGSDNVTLWDFRDTVERPADVLAMLTGVTVPFEIREAPARESLTKAAIEFLRDFQKLPGKKLPAKVLAEVARRLYPTSGHPEKFDPWQPEERAALLAHYQAEKTRLPVRKF